MHLTHEELIDVADGTRAESSMPHLLACDECRRELAGLRAMLAIAADADVPEPSPLFWDHLSARVRDDIEADRAGHARRARLLDWFSWKVALPAAACLAALVAVSLGQFGTPATDSVPPATIAADVPDTSPLPDDPSWTFVAGLASELGWDGAIEAGIAPSGGVDRAVFDLSLEERRALQRLIEEEIEQSKARSNLKS